MNQFLILLMLIMVFSCKESPKMQQNDVPAAAKTALETKYPDVKKVKWENEEGSFEAGFEMNGTEYSVLIDTNGNIIETEIQIKADALPLQVKAYIDKNHSGQEITEAAQITDANGTISFEAKLKNRDLIFDVNESFIKEILKKETEND